MSAYLLGFVASISGGFYDGPLASEAGSMSGMDICLTAGVTRSLGRDQDEAQPDSVLNWFGRRCTLSFNSYKPKLLLLCQRNRDPGRDSFKDYPGPHLQSLFADRTTLACNPAVQAGFSIHRRSVKTYSFNTFVHECL